MTSPTLSGLWLLARCPGSASLAHQRREGGNGSELGHAIHELLASRINGGSSPPTTPGGLAAKHDLAPDDAGRLGYLAAHLHLPVPPGALAEVSLGHWPDGHARRFTDEEMAAAHARGLRYPDIGQDISGTLDAMWAEPEPLFGFVGERSGVLTSECPPGSTLWVVDWKTGDMDNVPPVGRNWLCPAIGVRTPDPRRISGAQRPEMAFAGQSPDGAGSAGGARGAGSGRRGRGAEVRASRAGGPVGSRRAARRGGAGCDRGGAAGAAMGGERRER